MIKTAHRVAARCEDDVEVKIGPVEPFLLGGREGHHVKGRCGAPADGEEKTRGKGGGSSLTRANYASETIGDFEFKKPGFFGREAGKKERVQSPGERRRCKRQKQRNHTNNATIKRAIKRTIKRRRNGSKVADLNTSRASREPHDPLL